MVGTWGGGVLRAPLADPDVSLLTRKADGSGLRNKSVSAVLGRRRRASPGWAPFGASRARRRHHWNGHRHGGPRRTRSAGPTCSAWRSPRTMSISQARPRACIGSARAAKALDDRPTGLESHQRRPGLHPCAAACRPAGPVGRLGGGGLLLRDPGSGRFASHSTDRIRTAGAGRLRDGARACARMGYLWVGTRFRGLKRCRIEPWSCALFDGRRTVGTAWVASTSPRCDTTVLARSGLRRTVADCSGCVGAMARRRVRFERWGEEQGLLGDDIMSHRAGRRRNAMAGHARGAFAARSGHRSRREPRRGGRACRHVQCRGLLGRYDFLLLRFQRGTLQHQEGQPDAGPTAGAGADHRRERSVGRSRVALGPVELLTGLSFARRESHPGIRGPRLR